LRRGVRRHVVGFSALRKLLEHVHRADERKRVVHLGVVRRRVQHQLSPLRRDVCGGDRSHGVWRDVHDVPEPAECERDVRFRELWLQLHAELRGLRWQRRERL
jgi:hypothetical protein